MSNANTAQIQRDCPAGEQQINPFAFFSSAQKQSNMSHDLQI